MLEPDDVRRNAEQKAEFLTRCAAISMNPVRQSPHSCSRCCGALNAGVCPGCADAAAAIGLAADRVVPLTYAVDREQSGRNFYNYKDIAHDDRTQENAFLQVVPFMWGFSADHVDCLDRVSRIPVSAVCIVPSGRGRAGPHPLERVAQSAPRRWRRVDAIRTRAASTHIDPGSVSFAADSDLAGTHLAVIDDTWVKGAKAESVGMAARSRGASEITILPIARWLRPGFGETSALLEVAKARGPWSREVCPVTGSECP